jgi:ABC-type antimicrobial peptide transport system permease subunit
VWFNAIDDHYLPLHDHHLLAGRNLHAKTANAVEDEVIVNEEILKRFNIAQGNPAKAIGEIVTVNKKKLQVVGVVKNFHYGTVSSKIEPLIFRLLLKEENGNLNVKIKSTDWATTLASIERAWKKTDAVHPLKASFYKDQIEKTYREYSAMVKIVGFLTCLAICIASLGLLGMVVFTTETRLREISIRKVLGANEGMLVFLLSKGFLFMLLIAALVALPVTYFVFDKVILKNIIYRAPIGLFEMTSGLGMVAVIALVIILSQTLKASSRNPAEVLKNE